MPTNNKPPLNLDFAADLDEFINKTLKGGNPTPDQGHQLTDKKLEKLEKKIAKEYKTATKELQAKFKAYRKETEAARKVQESLYKSGKITKQDYINWQINHELIGKHWDDMSTQMAQDLTHADVIAKSIMNKAMPDIFALNANFATYQIEHDAAISTGFTLYNYDTAAYLLGDQRQLMPKPSAKKAAQIKANKSMQWNKQKIQSAVLQGVLQGESPYDVAERLRGIGQMNYNASIRYARTMTTSAQNAGRYEAYRRAKGVGVDLTIEWCATLDHRTRHHHRMMHGQRTEVDEPFHTPDGYTIYYPADCTGTSNAPQKEIWNCRCTLLSWVKGYEGDTVKSSPKIKDMTFEEWQTGKQKEAQQQTTTPAPVTAATVLTTPQNPYILKRDAVVANAKEFKYAEHEQTNFNYDTWNNELTGEERDGVYKYTGSSYYQMNKILRGRYTRIDPDSMRRIQGCESGLNHFALAEDTILYRGMGGVDSLASAIGISVDDLNEAIADRSIIGMRFCEKGFCSTGVSKDAGWNKSVDMTIFAPQNTVGMYVDPISYYRGEHELLLQHHTWFEILDADMDRYGNLKLKVYVAEQTPEKFAEELAARKGGI